jgi:hypothetical protein
MDTLISVIRYNDWFAQSWHPTPQGSGYGCPRDGSPHGFI